jgi:Leucine-rich repeat (LRR) protein
MPADALGALTAGVRNATIHNGDSLQSWTNILTNLQHLKLYHTVLTELPFHLDTLSLHWCHVHPHVEFHCKILHVNSCTLFDVNRLSHMTWLENLKLNGITIYSLEFAKHLEGLHGLLVSRCRSLADVSDLQRLIGLQTLTLEYCPQLINIESVSHLTNLTELDLLECHQIKTQHVQLVVNRLPKLKHLSILHHTLTKLTLSKMPHLTYLCLYDCVELTDLRELPATIIELNLENCSELTDFSELARLVHLRDLNLWGTKISALPNLASLRMLNVAKCHHLTDCGLLSVLPCPNLHSVLMDNCDLLSDRVGDCLTASKHST